MGRTLFVGDIHGCAREFDKLLRAARPSRVILVGDLFCKGPDPGGVWKLIKRWDAQAVLGNGDERLLREGHVRIPKRARHWLDDRPWILRAKRWIAVHAGLDPLEPKRTRRSQALRLRRFPDDSNPANPHWWSLYRGRRLVVHGHDARVGLNDRRPWSLGLDTACVKGGALTGYLLEKDRLISVQARKPYT